MSHSPTDFDDSQLVAITTALLCGKSKLSNHSYPFRRSGGRGGVWGGGVHVYRTEAVLLVFHEELDIMSGFDT